MTAEGLAGRLISSGAACAAFVRATCAACVSLANLAFAVSAFAATTWPLSHVVLQPGESLSSQKAVFPPTIVVPPGPDVPADLVAFSGRWTGHGGRAQEIDVKLAVERLTSSGGTIVHAAASDRTRPYSERITAKWEDGELWGRMKDGAELVYRMRGGGVLEMYFRKDDGPWFLGVLTKAQDTSLVGWPLQQASQEPGASQSTSPAPSIDDVAISSPPENVPAELAALSGRWGGWAGRNRVVDVRLAISVIGRERADLVYAIGSAGGPVARVPCTATFNGREWVSILPGGNAIAFRLRPDRHLDYLWISNQTSQWIAGVLSR